MIEPVVLVHGGAGAVAESLYEPHLQGVLHAVRAGYAALSEGRSALDAVQIAVKLMEDNEIFNAGHGSVLNIDGEVEMDAIIMEGTQMKTGAVGALKNVAHPIDVARLVMEKTPHCLLVGEGAKRFADEMGVPDVPMSQLITQRSIEVLEKFKNNTAKVENQGFGTVGALAVDAEGRVASATSTGGRTGKMVGRVGDSAIAGCGGYSDDRIGTVSTTGHGDSIIRVCMAHSILKFMAQGMTAQEATDKVCQDMTHQLGKEAASGAITLSNKGDVGVAFATKCMSWAYRKGQEIHYGIEHGQDFVELVEKK